MKTILQILLVSLLFSISAKAQKAWISPSPTDPKKRVKIYVDLDKMTYVKDGINLAGLKDQPGPFYLWTWNPQDQDNRIAKYKNGRSFSESNDTLIMKKDSALGPNVWYYEMTPTTFYNTTSEKVISTPLEFLVKNKDGEGGRKTEDIKLVIIPKITTRDTIYCSPFNLFPDEITTIYYNNGDEANPFMKNLGADSAYLYIKANLDNGSTMESYTPRINSWKNEAMKLELQSGSRLFSKKLILNELLKEKNLDNAKLQSIEITVIKKGATNGKGVSKEISKIFLGCR